MMSARVHGQHLGVDSSLSVQRRLVGTWTLQSTEEVLRDGSKRPYPDLGVGAKGSLLYGADGHMCVMLTQASRPKWTHDEETATDQEKVAAGSGFSSYCGTYKVDEKRREIVHLPELSFVPNYVGTEQRRPYRLDGNHLIFSGRESGGKVLRWTIVWEKAVP
jgi:hypothetical protein